MRCRLAGNLLREAGRLDQAEDAYRLALRHWRGPRAPWGGLALSLLGQGRLAEARACLAGALRQGQGDSATHSSYLATLLYDPDVSPEHLHAEHRRWGDLHAPPSLRRPFPQRLVEPGRRLRVGYVSPDFRRHALASFLEPILRHHDRQTVEVFCYAEVASPDEMTERLRGLAEHWRLTVGLSDEQVAEQVQRDGIEVLVDLAGHTLNNRLGVFARQPAPVQVSYLGYPCSTGVAAIGWRLGDGVTDPQGEEAPAGEGVVRLAGCFCCYAPPREVEQSEGLPEERAGAVTFGSLHKLEKLNERVLDVWGRLLDQVPTARLLVCRHVLHGATAQRLRERLAQRGLGPGRVRLERVEAAGRRHLGAYGRVDVLLDCWPWGGHTTACEALWMGVPVVTLRGSHQAGRLTASVLECLGLGDLVARTEEEYVRVAAGLAGERGRRAELRAGLRARMLASPLCDGESFTRGLEQAYRRLARAQGP
ncbi:MAG: hypothetical protein L0Z62_28475 [Gemmataceae bacterium]|nr:hypothetical protein [Gemmataceae bacterium]